MKRAAPSVIVVDTREKRPYTFGRRRVVVRSLSVGDYSLAGSEKRVAVERKSYPDLFHSFTATRARMMVRLRELGALELGALVVDCSVSDVIAGNDYTAVSGRALLATVMAECARHSVLLVFAGDRFHGAIATLALLDRWAALYTAGRRGSQPACRDSAFSRREKLVFGRRKSS